MKKIKTLLLVLAGLLPITACNFTNNPSTSLSSDNESSSMEQSSTVISSSSSTSSSSSSSVEVNYKLESIDVSQWQTIFYTGYTFVEQCDFEVFAYYDDGGCELIDSSLIDATLISMTSDQCSYKNGEIITYPGKYDIVVNVSYTENGITASNTLKMTKTVDSVILEGIKEIKGIELVSYDDFIAGKTVVERLNGQLKVIFEDDTYEYLRFNSQTEDLVVEVYDVANPKQNIVSQPLRGDVNYNIVFKYKGFATNLTIKLEGYVKIKAEDLAFTHEDWDKYVSYPEGKNMMLVIPISLTSNGGRLINWNDTNLKELERSLFGDSNYTLKTYYEAASFDRVTFDGLITDVYFERELTAEDILGNQNALYQLMARSFAFVKEQHKNDIDWSEYDINADGYIDNVYFLTNYISYTWQDTLWPHKSSIQYNNFTPDPENPVPYQYILSNSSYVKESYVTIHEQGHAFGLVDYYDYSNGSGSYRNYVGCADMQSHNMFDWNSYSKLSVGWVDPIVVTGNSDEVTITISAAATTGDCIVIPADYSEWNRSAFDEYFLIELFSPKGLNKDDWTNWERHYNKLGNGGIRLYHVDARLFEVESPYGTGQEIDYSKIPTNYYQHKYVHIGPNNSLDYTAPTYGYYNAKACKDFKHLAVIQATGIDTFGGEDGKLDALGKDDLFKTGDVFTFDKYSHFLSKSGVKRTTMDKGNKFPYTIEFVSVTADKATVKITKA